MPTHDTASLDAETCASELAECQDITTTKYLTLGKLGNEVVGNLLELCTVHGEELLQLVDLLGEVLGDIGHRSCHDARLVVGFFLLVRFGGEGRKEKATSSLES